MDLKVKEERYLGDLDASKVGRPGGSGVLVRAQYRGVWGSYDISELDDDSITMWFTRLREEGKIRIVLHLLQEIRRKHGLAE